MKNYNEKKMNKKKVDKFLEDEKKMRKRDQI